MPVHVFVAAMLVLLAAQDSAPAPEAPESQGVTGSGEIAEAATDAPTSAVATNADEDPDRMICRRPVPVLGSRVRMRRMCMTASQWRVYREGRDAMRRDWQNREDPLKFE